MSSVRELHDQAMIFAQRAIVARESGDARAAAEMAALAAPLETEAARKIERAIASEPTRSILYKSAGSLAYQAGDLVLAEQLVIEGLSGFPPPRVRQQLKDLYEQVNFASHLQVRNVELKDSQLQLALVGENVGAGQMTWSDFKSRADVLVEMLDRTHRRLKGVKFESRRNTTDAARPFVPLIASPRIGSFAVTIEMAERANSQRDFFVTGSSVIEQVVEGVQLIQNNDLDSLRNMIDDEDYFTNFAHYARTLAPDGTNVTMVGLTTPQLEVSFTRPREEMTLALPVSVEKLSVPSAPVRNVWHGVLESASLTDDSIGLHTDERGLLTLTVAAGMVDIVRLHFGSLVEATTLTDGKDLQLLDIRPLD